MPNITSNLLNSTEKLDIYGQPILSNDAITEYFSLNSSELKTLRSIRNIEHAVYFTISLVYFKLKGVLIPFTYQGTTKERQHLMKRYFPTKSSPKSLPQCKKVIARLENKVLKVTGFSRFTGDVKISILEELKRQAPKYPRQRQLCRKALELFTLYQCEIPGFTTLQTIITQICKAEHLRLSKLCYRHTKSTDRIKILALLEKTNKLHRIISIKSDMRNFTNTELEKELEKHQQLKPIFEVAASLLPKLKLF